jgi:hypothetical protein
VRKPNNPRGMQAADAVPEVAAVHMVGEISFQTETEALRHRTERRILAYIETTLAVNPSTAEVILWWLIVNRRDIAGLLAEVQDAEDGSL